MAKEGREFRRGRREKRQRTAGERVTVQRSGGSTSSAAFKYCFSSACTSFFSADGKH